MFSLHICSLPAYALIKLKIKKKQLYQEDKLEEFQEHVATARLVIEDAVMQLRKVMKRAMEKERIIHVAAHEAEH